MSHLQLFATNYNANAMWAYESLQRWLADRGVDFVMAQCATEDEVISRAENAYIYLAFRFKVTRKVIAALPRLKLIMASGNGYDHIDVQAATDSGVIVTNNATYNVEDVAQHALALILLCNRDLLRLRELARDGQWQCGAPVQPTHRFGNQIVGVIGFGKIGRILSRHARALGFKVLADDPYVLLDEMIKRGVEPVGLDELLRRSDYVTLHVPLTAKTYHMLSTPQFDLMKPTAWVINTARGAVIDESALISTLHAGQIRGAALDVLEQEPPARANTLLSMKNVIVTGHAAGTSQEGIEAWQEEWRTIITSFLAGYWPINVVNPDVQPKISLKIRDHLSVGLA